MDFDVEVLTGHVLSRPALWDRRHKHHNNRAVVEKMWSEVSQEMRLPKDVVKRKWKYLRDQFRNECKKIPKEQFFNSLLTADDYDGFTAWPHFKSLFFLKSQMKCRKFPFDDLTATCVKTSFLSEDSEQQMDADLTNDAEQHEYFKKMFLIKDVASVVNEEFDHRPTASSTAAATATKTAKQSSTTPKNFNFNASREDYKTLDANTQQWESQSHSQTRGGGNTGPEEHDEDAAFFISLLPHIRKLTPSQKLLCRIDIQSVVYKHVYKVDAACQS